MEEDKFIGAEDYSYNQELSFKQLCLEHLRRVLNLGSKEMRGGYFIEKPAMDGKVLLRVYIEDSREAYINAIKILHSLLFSHFDKQMKVKNEELEEKLNKLHKETISKIEKLNMFDKKREIEDLSQKYKEGKLEIKDLLFRELCNLLFRLTYLDVGKEEDRK